MVCLLSRGFGDAREAASQQGCVSSYRGVLRSTRGCAGALHFGRARESFCETRTLKPARDLQIEGLSVNTERKCQHTHRTLYESLRSEPRSA